MKTGFIGAGKVGCSLGKYLSIRGITVTGYYDRDTKMAHEAAQFTGTAVYDTQEALIADSEVLFITVPDGLISKVFSEIKELSVRGKYICHCSGSISSKDAFPGIAETGAYGFSLHPLFAVSDRFGTYRELSDAFFTLEGDPERIGDMQQMLDRAEMKVRTIAPESKTRYHLAAVYSSNLMLALIEEGILLLRECGFEEEDARAALSPLIRGNVEHALEEGPVRALTGPVERGDISTIRRHLGTMSSEEDRSFYRMLSARLLPLAKAKNPDRDYSELEEFLKR